MSDGLDPRHSNTICPIFIISHAQTDYPITEKPPVAAAQQPSMYKSEPVLNRALLTTAR